MTNYIQILDDAYSSAEQIQNVDETFTFSNEVKGYIETIVDKAENSKAPDFDNGTPKSRIWEKRSD